MRKPSNRMPQAPKPKFGITYYFLLLLFVAWVGGLLWAYYNKPVFWAIIVVLFIAVTIASRQWKQRIEKLAAERKDEDICTFARSFDCRNVDTWIIRATYEELQKYLSTKTAKLALRASDRLKEDLEFDPQDLDDIAYDIAARANYDMTDTKNNPLYDKVKTVADLVSFFSYQPKLKTAEQNAQPDSQ